MPGIFDDEQCFTKPIWPYPFATSLIFLLEADKYLKRASLLLRSFSTSSRKISDADTIVKSSPQPRRMSGYPS